MAQINGTSGDDDLQGTADADVIHGLDGTDILNGLDGDDELYGDGGSDTLIGGAGDDLLSGGGFEFYADQVSYMDSPNGVTVSLAVEGPQATGRGNDTLVDIVHLMGSNFNDQLTGDETDNRLFGQEGDDQLLGGAGNDKLYGSAGNDILEGGTGLDTLDGGEGDDIYYVDADDPVHEFDGQGFDTVYASSSTFISAAVERVVLVGTGDHDALFSGATNVYINGNSGSNLIWSGDGDDQLLGLAGDDDIDGGGGDDFIDGGSGADTMDGAEGSDIYLVASVADYAADTFVDSGLTGIDELRFASSGQAETLVLRPGDSGIERLVIGTGTAATAHTTGSANHNVDARLLGYGISILGNSGANKFLGTGFGDQLDGGAGADRLLGYAGDDVLDGGKQVDSLVGGLGDDTYIVDSNADATLELVGEGTDTVVASVAVTLRANVENLVQSGVLGINATGNALDNVMEGNVATNRLFGLEGSDTLIGNEGNDQLDGGAGADMLIGGVGNDLYFVDSAADTVTELAGEGRDTVRATASYTLSDEVEWLELQGSVNLDGTGNGLANVLRGNDGDNGLFGLGDADKIYAGAGNDSVDGGEGNDVLEGGTGSDEFTGGAGLDRFLFREGDFGGATIATADVIHDFSHAEGDKIHLSTVDANSTLAGNQAFAFLGTGAFTGVAGELRYEQADGNTFVQGDIDGDGIADFVIQVDGTVNLVSGDFVL